MKVDRKITLALTESEIAQMAEQAAKLQGEMFTKQIAFDAYKKREKGQIDELKGMVIDLLRNVERKTKEIVVECEEQFNFEDRTIRYWSEGKEVDMRSMGFEEFDTLVVRHCKMTVDELNNKRCYYYKDVLVYERPMTAQEVENHKQLLLMPEVKSEN